MAPRWATMVPNVLLKDKDKMHFPQNCHVAALDGVEVETYVL